MITIFHSPDAGAVGAGEVITAAVVVDAVGKRHLVGDEAFQLADSLVNVPGGAAGGEIRVGVGVISKELPVPIQVVEALQAPGLPSGPEVDVGLSQSAPVRPLINKSTERSYFVISAKLKN